MILRTRACFAYLTSIPAMQLVNVFFQGEDDVLWKSNGFIEGLRRVSVFFTVWWGLVLAFCWETLISWPVVSYTSRPTLIASSYEMGSQWLGAWMGLTSGSRSRSTGGPRKPRPWKSEVQFLEMNSRVPSVGQTRIDVSGGDGGGPAADIWWLSGSVVGGWEGLLVEHFLMKSARRVSTSSALLA